MSARDPIPHPDDIARVFFARTHSLSRRQRDWLMNRHGVAPLTIAGDGDGAGWMIATARVERVGRRFQFRPEDGAETLIAVARDELGADLDLVAWSPRERWTAPWIGDAGLLGMQDLLSHRFVDPLRVCADFLSWLQGGRNGVVILDPREARRQLAGLTLMADDLDHGVKLKRLLEGPTPRIVVPASAIGQVAA